MTRVGKVLWVVIFILTAVATLLFLLGAFSGNHDLNWASAGICLVILGLTCIVTKHEEKAHGDDDPPPAAEP